MTGLTSRLYEGAVVHQRFAPRRHRLRYRMFQILFDLRELKALDRACRLFSLNRFNLFAFHERDHGDGRADLEAYVREVLFTAGIEAGGRIQLLCMPRILGHVFNPLSIYYCHRPDGSLAAMLYEVNNTFGERHSYLIPVDAGANGVVRQACDKQFYVSPFMDMEMAYDFRLNRPAETITTAIQGRDADGELMIAAVFSGRRRSLSDRSLARAFLAFPLLTLKVVAAIHWEAVQIFLKGVGFRRRPAAPSAPISLHPSPREETPASLRPELLGHALTVQRPHGAAGDGQ